MATYYEVIYSSGGERLSTSPPNWQAVLKEARERWSDYDDSELLLYEMDEDNQRLRPIWADMGPGAWSSW